MKEVRFSGATRLVLFAATAAACNSLTGANDFVLDDRATSPAPDPSGSSGTSGSSGSSANDAGNTTTTDAGSTNDASQNDATTDSGPSPNDIVLASPFDTASDCIGWGGTGTRAHDPAGRLKPGSCRLCAPNGGDVQMTKVGKAPHGGKLYAFVWARRVDGSTLPTNFTLGAITSSATINIGRSLAGTEWTHSTNPSGAPVQVGEDISIRISFTADQAGTCLLVDDVLAVVE